MKIMSIRQTSAKGARDPEPSAPGNTDAVAVIHRDQAGAECGYALSYAREQDSSR